MTELGRRFWESTRGQAVTLLRRGALTVEELAQSLGVTDNAVRSHLTVLERDGLVRQVGVRRGPGAGKPAVLYELHPDAQPLFSKAYAPTLSAVIDVLVDSLPVSESEQLLRKVGRRIANSVGGTATGTLGERVHAAARVLTALGGDVHVEETESALRIRGSGCPLSTVVSRRPEMCRAVEAMVSDVAGAAAESRCEHGVQPRCCFVVPRESAAA